MPLFRKGNPGQPVAKYDWQRIKTLALAGASLRQLAKYFGVSYGYIKVKSCRGFAARFGISSLTHSHTRWMSMCNDLGVA